MIITKVSFNLKSMKAESLLLLKDHEIRHITHWTWFHCFTKPLSWFSVCRSSLLWSMSSQQQKQPCTPPPPPQQQQVKQTCQPPPQEPFVPITKNPCDTKLPQPGNTKLPEPNYPKYPEPGHPIIPESGHIKVPEPAYYEVLQPGYTKVPEPSPSTIIPGQKTKQKWCGP